MKQAGKLYVVATPIGNYEDITLRAIRILKSVDAVICEERRLGSTLLKKLDITPAELLPLNEHNESSDSLEVITRLLQGQSMALISDAGTPVFADPGAHLIQQAVEMGVQVVPIPGPSSLMAALSVLDFKLEQFIFAGFLSRNPEKRRQELTRLRNLRMPVVLLDTPYRLTNLLEDIARTFGDSRQLTLAFDLTLPSEVILRGAPGEVLRRIGSRKGEFVLVIHAQG
jgi:16S rRNA (cytidine1402-2'-O)-methyltransferase